MGATATVIQFPIRLAYANTAHKFQGQTVPEPLTIAIDINSVFEAGQAYVMLSRIQCIDQLYIVKKMNSEKIKASSVALEELKRLEKISFNRNPSPWHERCDRAIKIATVNCAGLLPHLRDIRKDQKLQEANVINLLETSLPSNADTEDLKINGYNGIQAINGK